MTGLNLEVMAAGFMLGSAIFQGIVESSLKIVVFFLIPAIVLMVMQWRRLVYLPMKEWKKRNQDMIVEIDEMIKKQEAKLKKEKRVKR
jgi:hypothetical protein